MVVYIRKQHTLRVCWLTLGWLTALQLGPGMHCVVL